MSMPHRISRRAFLGTAPGVLAVAGLSTGCQTLTPAEPIIDIHQHTNYSGRTHEQLLAHQNTLGVTRTVLLPAGRFYGLDANCGGNESVIRLARQYPRRFVYFANEVTDLPDAVEVIRWHLRRGALGIGEQKFRVACDSPEFERIARLAEEFRVPVLMHFQHGAYNTGIERFHIVLERFPKVNFIGHAQTWWANVSKDADQAVMYPKGKVVPGGITDRLLSDYPNMYGDTSAGSGLNFLTRDDDFARDFLQRHQDKLLFGTDCNDTVGSGSRCQGAQILSALRRLAPSKTVERKILYHNAQRLLRI